MSLKNFIILLIGFVAGGLYLLKYHYEYAFDFFAILFTGAIIAELGRMFLHRNKSSGPVVKKPRFEETHDGDGNLYHNDFSKVPAGTHDEKAPLLRPRGMIIGDPYRAIEENFKEDMERLGFSVEQDEKDKPKKEDI